jgi:hypothetical protein
MPTPTGRKRRADSSPRAGPGWFAQLNAPWLVSLIHPNGRYRFALVPPITLFLATEWWLLAAGTDMTYYLCR